MAQQDPAELVVPIQQYNFMQPRQSAAVEVLSMVARMAVLLMKVVQAVGLEDNQDRPQLLVQQDKVIQAELTEIQAVVLVAVEQAQQEPIKQGIVVQQEEQDYLVLLQEAQYPEQAEAEAEFWMVDSDVQDRTSYTGMLLPGDLYYKAQIMLTSSAVSVRATDVIIGSANFVTVREVQLREG